MVAKSKIKGRLWPYPTKKTFRRSHKRIISKKIENAKNGKCLKLFKAKFLD